MPVAVQRPGQHVPTVPPALPLQFVMGSLFMKSTERDPNFLDNMQRALGGDKKRKGEGTMHHAP